MFNAGVVVAIIGRRGERREEGEDPDDYANDEDPTDQGAESFDDLIFSGDSTQLTILICSDEVYRLAAGSGTLTI